MWIGRKGHVLGKALKGDISIRCDGNLIWCEKRSDLQRLWTRTSFEIQSLRDNPECAREEFEKINDSDLGLSANLTFDLEEDVSAPFLIGSVTRPKIAVLREQGINGQLEMAAAFDRAGFISVDVHMSDLKTGRFDLSDFKGMVACGGFSYGDVLGAGQGWSKGILLMSRSERCFFAFERRILSPGVCNGCQMLSGLKELIPALHAGQVLFAIDQSNLNPDFHSLELRITHQYFYEYGWISYANRGGTWRGASRVSDVEKQERSIHSR